jgi:SAM-dependent methyltransferase
MTITQLPAKVFRRIEVTFLYITGKLRALFSHSRYNIKRGYRHRDKAVYFDDTALKDEYQREVYELARFYLNKYHYTNVVDIGCGSGYKLLQFFSDYDTTGIEVSPTYEFLLAKYPGRKWINALHKEQYPSVADVIICADVIEHLEDPDELIETISNMEFKFLFLSTPERDLARGWYDYGPPDNTAHVREWNAKELRQYISNYFEIVSHQVTNIEDATQLLICRKKGNSSTHQP